MNNKIIILIASILLFIATPLFADPLLLTPIEMEKLQKYFPNESDAHLIWQGDPLTIELPISQEKRIIFPDKIIPDLKGNLNFDQLRILNNNGSLYLTALKPFPKTRLFVTIQNTGEVLLIDLLTNDKASESAIHVDIKAHNQKLLGANNDFTFAESENLPDVPVDSEIYITLLRFAWQQLYSPERLLGNPLNISRAPMQTSFLISTLLYGDKVYAHPIASWVYKNTYVTAVELRNKYPNATTINLSHDLCGSWQAATLYPYSYLKSAGNKPYDSAVLFVISKKPFAQSMEVCHVNA